MVVAALNNLYLYTWTGLARTVHICTVFDRIFGDFPAINTIHTVFIWFWPTLHTEQSLESLYPWWGPDNCKTLATVYLKQC
jgi:hypothetical protein